MVLPLIGALVGAGSSLIGGMMQSNAQRDANNANIAAQEAANEKNYQAQKEFAQQGLRWKVDDAKAAGLHPLIGAGAQAQNFSPSYVGAQVSPVSGMAEGMAAAGNDIGRAIAATQTGPEKALSMLQLERASLENDLLRTQIRRQIVETGPSFPTVNSGSGITGNSEAALMFHGNKWDTNPKTSDTQKIADRYGDLASWLYGLGVAGSDLAHNGVFDAPDAPTWRGQPDYHGMNKRGFIEQLGMSLALETLRRELTAK